MGGLEYLRSRAAAQRPSARQDLGLSEFPLAAAPWLSLAVVALLALDGPWPSVVRPAGPENSVRQTRPTKVESGSGQLATEAQ